MDEPPFSLAFVMVKESFAGPAILFYLASDANKNKRQDHLKTTSPKRKATLISEYVDCKKGTFLFKLTNC
jgi:hypothetical protein